MILVTGGTFDLIHYGHILHLRTCSGLAGGMENVHVMLVSDRWAKARKGDLRTIISWEERKEVLSALGVRHIHFIDKPEDIVTVIIKVKPDIYIYEYNSNPTAHDAVLKSTKGVHLINLGKNPVNPFGTSTSKIIERIKNG